RRSGRNCRTASIVWRPLLHWATTSTPPALARRDTMPRRPRASSSAMIARSMSGHAGDCRAKRETDEHCETAAIAPRETELSSFAVELGQSSRCVGESDAMAKSSDVFEARPVVVDAQGQPTVLTLRDDRDRSPTLAGQDRMTHRVLDERLQDHGRDEPVRGFRLDRDVDAQPLAKTDRFDAEILAREVDLVPQPDLVGVGPGRRAAGQVC